MKKTPVILKSLLIARNQIVRKVHAWILEELGYQVYVAESNRRVLQLIKTYSYEIALIDIGGLHDISSIEIIKLLKKSNALTKIIAVTSYIGMDEEIIKNCLEAGSNIVLGKPLTKETLQQYLK